MAVKALFVPQCSFTLQILVCHALSRPVNTKHKFTLGNLSFHIFDYSVLDFNFKIMSDKNLMSGLF